MIEALRMALAAVAAPWCINQYAIAINRGCRLRAAVAVYIAITADGHVDYVGSTARMSSSALHDRIREHVSDQRRSDRWVSLVALELRPDAPTVEARRIEGEVGRLLKPLSSRRLPKARLAS